MSMPQPEHPIVAVLKAVLDWNHLGLSAGGFRPGDNRRDMRRRLADERQQREGAHLTADGHQLGDRRAMVVGAQMLGVGEQQVRDQCQAEDTRLAN